MEKSRKKCNIFIKIPFFFCWEYLKFPLLQLFACSVAFDVSTCFPQTKQFTIFFCEFDRECESDRLLFSGLNFSILSLVSDMVYDSKSSEYSWIFSVWIMLCSAGLLRDLEAIWFGDRDADSKSSGYSSLWWVFWGVFSRSLRDIFWDFLSKIEGFWLFSRWEKGGVGFAFLEGEIVSICGDFALMFRRTRSSSMSWSSTESGFFWKRGRWSWDNDCRASEGSEGNRSFWGDIWKFEINSEGFLLGLFEGMYWVLGVGVVDLFLLGKL